GFYAAPGDKESREVVQTVLAAIGYRSQLTDRLSLSPRVSYRYGYDDYRYFRHDLNRARSQHHGHSINTEVNATLQTGVGDIGVGVETRNEIIRSSNIGNHNRDNYRSEERRVGKEWRNGVSAARITLQTAASACEDGASAGRR